MVSSLMVQGFWVLKVVVCLFERGVLGVVHRPWLLRPQAFSPRRQSEQRDVLSRPRSWIAPQVIHPGQWGGSSEVGGGAAKGVMWKEGAGSLLCTSHLSRRACRPRHSS